MRLIDADALTKALGKWIEAHYTDTFSGDDAGSEFAYMIGCTETIDSTVYARWIDQGHKVFKCSNCGNYLDFREGSAREEAPHPSPFFGAKRGDPIGGKPPKGKAMFFKKDVKSKTHKA